jgi:hypothetical protein
MMVQMFVSPQTISSKPLLFYAAIDIAYRKKKTKSELSGFS